MKPIVSLIIVSGLAIALLLGTGQNPFAKASFEYGIFRPYSGTLEEWPVPVLTVGSSQYLLVGPGKRGVTDVVKGSDRQGVELQGSLIQRGRHRMLELAPETFRPSGVTGEASSRVIKGQAQFTGEVVDSKCYLGVMNPGQGKVHRACAARCISGGVPAALAVDDRLLLLLGADDQPINRELLPFAGERITVRGELIHAGALEIFRISPADIRRE